tara:strand:+ start:4707 stop:4967 length:261 start_codon:yes stop_codon:yes gene_type:complete
MFISRLSLIVIAVTATATAAAFAKSSLGLVGSQAMLKFYYFRTHVAAQKMAVFALSWDWREFHLGAGLRGGQLEPYNCDAYDHLVN